MTTTYLFCLTRLDRGSDRWIDLADGCLDRRAFVNRLAQDGIDRQTADRWAKDAALSVFAPTTEYVIGDRFDYNEVGPGGESYRVLAIAVTPPSLTNDTVTRIGA